MNSGTLILFTNTFPYDKGEEFLETEILFLANSFKQVVIYPYSSKGVKRKLPENVEVRSINFSQDLSAKQIILKHWMQITKVLKYELLFSKYRFAFLKTLRNHFNTLIWNIHNSLILKQELETYNLSDIKLYTYWFNNWGRLLSLTHLLSSKKMKFVSRVHGYDYDPSRRKEGFIPFRNFEMNQVSKIFSISNYGIRLLKKEYAFFKNTHLSRLGVSDHGTNPINKGVFHIVSCSSLIELKRVELIVEILKHTTFQVKWTHFGDGELETEIKEKAKKLPENVITNFEGFKSNSHIIEFYKTVPVDYFLNVSRIEGVPVSIMEAISFGIPCIGCNVGGVSEIVNEHTGYLIDKDFDAKRIADFLTSYSKTTFQLKESKRAEVKEFWKKNYDAHKNYTEFINQI